MHKALPPQQWQSQAPANTMLLGEHSVVYGHPALACALDQFVTIRWQARPDKALHIHSALGNHQTQIDQITLHPKLKFVVAALQAFQNQLPHGLELDINSEFSSTVGLGSSAAVLAAMLVGLDSICQTDYDTQTLFMMGHKIIIDIQGRGSGTDLAASLAGGWIYFQPKSAKQAKPLIKRIDIDEQRSELALQLIYCGYKTPTAEVLKMVAEQWQDKPKQLEMLYRSMAQVTRSAYQYLQHNDLDNFFQQVKSYQHLMEQLGVSDATLENIIQALNGCVDINASKISGSGLGDCVLGFGHIQQCSSSSQHTLNQFQHIKIQASAQGAQCQSLQSHF